MGILEVAYHIYISSCKDYNTCHGAQLWLLNISRIYQIAQPIDISLKMLSLKASETLDHLCIKTGPLVIIAQHNLNAADIKNCACLFEPPRLVVQNIHSSHTGMIVVLFENSYI